MEWSEYSREIATATGVIRIRLTVRGRVQGVGFRPSVYRFAADAGVAGHVRNTGSGVLIEVEGELQAIDLFGRALTEKLPPLARLDSLVLERIEPEGDTGFVIEESEQGATVDALFPVDTAICGDCLAEMADPSDPRYRYPFINCTNCGPRFTIIEDLPYDRSLTTMKMFSMDDLCRGQYADPLDRRFHAEPISCPGCGPVLTLLGADGETIEGDPIDETRKILGSGGIVAVKGLGGYHLACMATDGKAVELLRKRKKRPAKPFALMFENTGILEEYCLLSEVERSLLTSPESPIVLLKSRKNHLPQNVAPGNAYIGAFLPYTPVHHLIIKGLGILVMTSGNFTDEPLISTEEELDGILGSIADAALVNDRRIAHKCDDSIFFVPSGTAIPLRRARGYVPEPVRLPQFHPVCVLGTGGQEKGTFALTRGENAYVSPHLGDLGDLRSQHNYRREIGSFRKILGVEPEIVVCDLHPDYFTTRFAEETGCARIIHVQHHHAHAVSVMVEHGLEGPVIAVTFDGTGYGSDGNLWGGEFLLAEHHDFRRLAHFSYVPLPGGSVAVRQPWRMALIHLWKIYGDRLLEDERIAEIFDGYPARSVLDLARKGVNSFPTSSIGRLFDAAAFLLGCGGYVSFEAQAAIELESLALQAGSTDTVYDYRLEGTLPLRIDTSPVIEAIIGDLAGGRDRAEIAASFHNTIARIVSDLSVRFSAEQGCTRVVLSGGVFQNRFLCEKVIEEMAEKPVRLYQHSVVPPNDGGISLGQVQAGIAKIIKGVL